MRLYAGPRVGWHPLDIPRSQLFGLLDAEAPGTITQSGGAVSAFVDQITRQSWSQGTGANQPAYSATSFNGRPGITFDGSNDYLRNANTQMWPTSGAFEIWLVMEFTTAGAPASGQIALEFPASTNSLRCRVSRNTADALFFSVGNGSSTDQSTQPPTSPYGRNLIRCVASGSQIWFEIGDTVSDPVANAPSLDTVNTRNTLGASGASTPANYAPMIFNFCAVTRRLTSDAEAKMRRYLNARLA